MMLRPGRPPSRSPRSAPPCPPRGGSTNDVEQSPTGSGSRTRLRVIRCFGLRPPGPAALVCTLAAPRSVLQAHSLLLHLDCLRIPTGHADAGHRCHTLLHLCLTGPCARPPRLLGPLPNGSHPGDAQCHELSVAASGCPPVAR